MQINPVKTIFILVIGIYGYICASDVSVYRFLDGVDLIFHEAGHVVFGIFGGFIGILGGTLGQLIVPSGMSIYFALKREFYSASIGLFWLGQSLFNVSVYMKDARTMELPLIGGEDVIHDWNYILSNLGLLRYDLNLSAAVYWIGAIFILGSFLSGLYFSFEFEEER